jgi:hypothetical protein
MPEFKFTKYLTHDKTMEGVNDCINWLFVAFDSNPIKGVKTFSRFRIIDDKMKIISLLKTDQHMYEWIKPDIHIKPFWDCEMEGDEFSIDESYKRICLFIDFVIEEMNGYFKSNITKNDFILLNSSRQGKLSYHIILNEYFYFENMAEHRLFTDWLLNRLIDSKHRDIMTWTRTNKGGKIETLRIFDMNVYSKEQKIRCINQSKKGKNHILKNDDIPVIESLIGLYWGLGDRKKINVPTMEYEMKQTKTKQTKTKKLNDKLTQSVDCGDYITTGQTIMEKENETYDDLAKYPEYEQYIRLIPNSSQSYGFYFKVFAMLKQAGGNAKLFYKWASLYTDTPDDSVIREFNAFKVNNEYNGLQFLRKYAKISHPDFFNTDIKLLNDYFTPRYGNIETITETCNFVSQEGTPYEKDIESDHKIILIKADLGGGKSTAIKRILPRYKKGILIITPRITYCQHAVKEFGVSSYLDGDFDTKNLACSLESFHKIPNTRKFECVILDECEAILSNFSSSTLQNRQLETYNKLKDIIDSAKKVIFAGAFITQKTVDFIDSFNVPALLIRNDRITARKTAYEIDPKIFNLKLIKYIENGGKPYIYWCSKKEGETFIAQFQGYSMNNEMMTEKLNKMLFYNSDSDDAIFQGLQDINKTWDDASFVMATPTITVGNSYSPPNTTFSSVWVFGFPSCIVADAFQGHKRVRHTTTNTLYYSIPDATVIKFLSNQRCSNIKTLADYENLTNAKIQVVLDHTQKQINKNKNDNNEAYLSIQRALTTEYETTPLALRNLLFQNLYEMDLSVKCFKDMFIRFIDICGYDLQTTTKTSKKDKDEINGLVEGEIDNSIKYENIKPITDPEMEILKQKINRKQATREEKLQIQRFYFDQRIDADIPEEAKEKYFQMFINTSKRVFLDNLYMESRNMKDYAFMNEFADKNNSAENIQNNSLKLHYIREITFRLGLTNSIDTSTITREKMGSLNEYLHGEREKINTVFSLRDQATKPTANLKNTTSMLRKILKTWNGTELEDNAVGKHKPATQFNIFGNYLCETVGCASNSPPYRAVITNREELIRGLDGSLLIHTV